MPNHVTNQLVFDCPEEEFLRVAESVRREGSYLGSVDFNRILPMPPELDIEAGSRGEKGLQLYRSYLREVRALDDPSRSGEVLARFESRIREDPEAWELGKAYHENIERFRAPHWYDWCIRNWGTKWNAYDCHEVEPGSKELRFLTAWSAVPDLVSKISDRFPDVEIAYGFADEDIGRNVGTVSFRGGKLVDHDIPAPGSREAYEMAARIMEVDLRDYGITLPEPPGRADAPER